MAKRINFFDGATSSTTPTIGNLVASDIVQYANDAAFEAGEEGSPTTGNIYFNTTSHVIRYYNGTSWITLVDLSTSQTLTNKILDGTSATGTNNITNDADKITYDNGSSGLTATDLQAATDELDTHIDNLETLSGSTGATHHGTFTGTTIADNSTTKSALQALETAVESKINSSEKGANNGVATLDSGGKVPATQLPSTVMELQGSWNASTNTPTLADGVGSIGDVYEVTVAGTQNLGSGSITFAVGDWAVYAASGVWYKSLNSNAVTSVNGYTGTVSLVKGDIGLGNVDNTSDSTKNSATADLSNKTFTDSVTIQEQSSTPSTPSSGDQKIYPKTNGKWYTLDDAGTESEVGSGSGSGGINYILNPGAETDTSGWATYDEGSLDSVPTDGTGGTATTTWTRSTSSPLRKDASFLLTKASGDEHQGEGVSYDFTIDSADKAKVLSISFDYLVSSGTYATGDLAVYIYDVTNSQVIQPTGYQIESASVSMKHNATFQTNSNSTSYRLIIHVASTQASAYTMKFDNFIIGPQVITQGTPKDDFISVTPTFTGFGTVTNIEVYSRRDGDCLEMQGNFTTGTTTATEARISLAYRSGTVTSYAIPSIRLAGTMVFSSSAAAIGTTLIEPSVTYLTIGTQDASAAGLTKQNGNTFSSSSKFSFWARVPIAGWSSNVQMSSSTDTRATVAIITGNPASASSGNPIIVPTILKDTHGCYNSTDGRYTVAVPGTYKMFGALSSASSATTLSIYKDGSVYQLCGNLDSNGEATFAGMVDCIAGSIIDIRPGGTVDATDMSLNIERTSGPSQIAASESVNMMATSSTTSLDTSTPTIVNGTVVFDSHGGYNSSNGVYTCKLPGKYEIVVGLRTNAVVIGVGGIQEIYVKHNSDANIPLFRSYWSSSTYQIMLNGTYTFNCLAGDTLKCLSYQNSTVSLDGSTANFMSIKRVGN